MKGVPSSPWSFSFNPHRVGVHDWGFVAGKTQTFLPWDSWRHPYVRDEPSAWFHDVLRPDGTAYREAEVALIRELTGKQ